MNSIQKVSSNRRFQAETTRLLDERYRLHVKAYTDGSKKEEKVRYAVVLPEKNNKNKATTIGYHKRNIFYNKMQRGNSDHH
jgi:hypothetical protein